VVGPLYGDRGVRPRPAGPAVSADHRDFENFNLNIASAHVSTFGERARDVFYVTDLLGAQINAPTRQAAIKSALIHLPRQRRGLGAARGRNRPASLERASVRVFGGTAE